MLYVWAMFQKKNLYALMFSLTSHFVFVAFSIYSHYAIDSIQVIGVYKISMANPCHKLKCKLLKTPLCSLFVSIWTGWWMHFLKTFNLSHENVECRISSIVQTFIVFIRYTLVFFFLLFLCRIDLNSSWCCNIDEFKWIVEVLCLFFLLSYFGEHFP